MTATCVVWCGVVWVCVCVVCAMQPLERTAGWERG